MYNNNGYANTDADQNVLYMNVIVHLLSRI